MRMNPVCIRQFRFLAPLAALLLLSGCAKIGAGFKWLRETTYEPRPEPAEFVPIDEEANPVFMPVAQSQGSLWTDQSVNLFADDKAFRKGDTILVKVTQKNSGSKKANTDTSRESSVSANIRYALGLEDEINGLTGFDAAAGGDPPDLLKGTTGNEYKGEGSTDRTDIIEATVSAVVKSVLNNGNLVIYGHQTLTLNNEASVLTVQGIVRPSDIGDDNMIDSSRISNANIEFTGSGVLSDKQKPGWFTRLFDWFWPI